jgi:hypothetical protein
MKILFIAVFITFTGFSFSQIKGTAKTQTNAAHKSLSKHSELTRDVNKAPDIYGDFIIQDFEIIIRKGDTEKVSKNLLGTVIKITEVAIAGEQVDPMTYNLTNSEMLFSEDYIYRAFEIALEDEIQKLPTSVLVHKTSNQSCYGILELDEGVVVLPYQGMLLFLVRP